jgi:hypothetical protein
MSNQLYGDDTPADVKNAKVCIIQRLGTLLEHRRTDNLLRAFILSRRVPLMARYVIHGACFPTSNIS